MTCPPGNLPPLQSITCTATHSVTQADLDAGSIVNTATAHAGGTDSNQAQATVPATQTPSLSLLKSITSGNPYAAVGAVVQYSYVVTNTGNVTVHALTVADDNVGAVAPTCNKVVLAPNESATCTASHTVTQADLDAGKIVNNASAFGLDPSNATVTSNTDSEIANATSGPGVTIVKSSNATAATKAGDVVTFSFVVTNTGNVTITSFVVTDPLPGMSAVDCGGVTSLAPMTATTCTATYTVKQADVDAGVIRNTATVNGQTPAGAVAADSTLSTPLSKTPAVTLVKSSNANASTKAGDVVTFNFVVTNTGNVTITSFAVTDPLPGLSAINCHGVDLARPARDGDVHGDVHRQAGRRRRRRDQQHGDRERHDRDRRPGHGHRLPLDAAHEDAGGHDRQELERDRGDEGRRHRHLQLPGDERRQRHDHVVRRHGSAAGPVGDHAAAASRRSRRRPRCRARRPTWSRRPTSTRA